MVSAKLVWAFLKPKPFEKKKVGVSDEPHRGPVWQITG